MDIKGFFTELFDLSFKSFITMKVIKLLYVVAIISSGFIGLMFLIDGIKTMKYSSGVGFFLIILAPLFTFIMIIWSRILLEIIVVFFKINENTTKLIEIKEKEINKGA